MKLSIITINYNNLAGLQQTINSVVGQTFSDYEWIVIDGGSTDGSKDYIQEHAHHLSYWVSEKDNGVYHAMNKGIAQAHGEWMLFLNSGDSLCDEYVLSKVVSHQLSGDVLYGNAYYVNPDGSYRIKRDPDDVGISFLLTQTFCHQATFVKASLLKDSPYDEQYKIAADWAKWFQLMVEGKHFVHVDEFVVNFDTTGIGSTPTESLRLERDHVLQQYLPHHVRIEADRIVKMQVKWGFLEQRKSLRLITKWFYKFCRSINWILNKIERIHRP